MSVKDDSKESRKETNEELDSNFKNKPPRTVPDPLDGTFSIGETETEVEDNERDKERTSN